MADTPASDHRREHDHNRSLGKRLALLRASKGLTLAEVANAVGISFGALQQYEAGTRGVSYGRLVEIARALDAPISTLVKDDPGEGADDGGDTGAVLHFARIASRLPRSKLSVLVAVARELGKP